MITVLNPDSTGPWSATNALVTSPAAYIWARGVGKFNAKIDNVSEATGAIGPFNSDDNSFKVFAGWRFIPYFVVELAYVDLGKPEQNVGGTKVEAERGVAPYLVGTLPLGPIELFAKVGYYFYDIKINEEPVRSLDETDADLAYAAGIGITLFGHLNTQLEYESIDASRLDKADALWLTAAWRF